MKLNLDRIRTISTTLEAIADIETAMSWYTDTSKQGPAYLSVKQPIGNAVVEFQLDRSVFIEIMQANKQRLINHLKNRFEGFEYDPNAHWSGDNQ